MVAFISTIIEDLADLHLLLVLAAVFGTVALFVFVGVRLFASGWQSYEERYIEGAERTLDAIYLTIPPQHLLYLSLASFAVLSLLWMWVFQNMLVGLVFGIMGLPLPRLLLWWLKRRRDRRFDQQLVGALANMGNSLRAGFSLVQAIDLVARESGNPMKQEMSLVVREMQVGVPMEQALQHLLARMPGQDLDLVVTAILISREVGGNLTEVFENISYTLRERHRIEGRIRALSSQGKLQGFVMVCIPPAMAVALSYIAPGMMAPLYTTPMGWVLMGLVVVLMVMGIYTIYRIVAIEV